jgi:two-component system sensor histidine kinase CiaH
VELVTLWVSRVFAATRWRLTLWFILVLGIILAITGTVVYLTTRAVLFDRVDSDLESQVNRQGPLLRGRFPNNGLGPPPVDIGIGSGFTAAGYFFALVGPTGELLASTANVDPDGLADADRLQEALDDGDAFANTESSEGDSLRVYVVPLGAQTGQQLLIEVGRSTEPEEQALRQLLFVLIGGGGAGLVLALVGGYLLAGVALRPIRAAMDSQRAFIADASHDLRTPLSVIRADAELLKRHDAEPINANREAVDDIIGESDRLGTMVGQMLILAQADAGQATLSLSEVALDELVTDVARSMRLLAAERSVSLETDVDGPLAVRGDSDRLRQLVVILTDNAIKYTDAGGSVRLEVRRPSRRKAVVRVSDTGCGIPAEALPRIFDRFYRVDKARSREAGGTGLGLAIARWIVEAHGGSIHVESEPGVGTTMTVELSA